MATKPERRDEDATAEARTRHEEPDGTVSDDATTGDGHRLSEVVDDLEEHIVEESAPTSEQSTQSVDTTPTGADDEAPD
ncbi:hypothetical protein [Nocardia callitridis]|uniref:Autophagy-related protein 2 n=1 Tax=Nocardia callitridis TaxID=648753 RepID=A0ABP9K8T6_9NOCA